MSKSERKYIIGLVAITLIAITIRLLRPAPIDWSEGYSASEKKPFGGYILFNELPTLFPDDAINTNLNPVFELIMDTTRANYIFVNQSLMFDEFEAQILLDKVNAGSNVFMATWNFQGALADSLNIAFMNGFPGINPSINSLDSLTQRRVDFSNPNINNPLGWNFPAGLIETYISKFDTSQTVVLGDVGAKRVNFIKYNLGEGAFYIHSNPFLFTNYFLRDENRFDYSFKALSYLPEQPTVWDEYYKIGRQQFNSPMAYFASQPTLRIAWFVTLFGLIIYLIFGSKRKQRIIPQINPVKNSSIEFAATIANLYLNNGTHAELLAKKLLFFKEYLRTNIGVTTDFEQSDAEQVAHRSGLAPSEIQTLFSMIRSTQTNTEISTEQLKQVTDQIDWFYKHSQR
ncbi:MAG: hypothetical protein JJ895_10180 [Balneolaceae bacterium]|nr:hypothetical protein [Balneolaceae bacterium]